MVKGYPALLCLPRSERSKDEGTTVRKGPKALLSCRLCRGTPSGNRKAPLFATEQVQLLLVYSSLCMIQFYNLCF